MSDYACQGTCDDHEVQSGDRQVGSDIPPSFMEPANLRVMAIDLLALLLLAASAFAGLGGVAFGKAGAVLGVGVMLTLGFLALLAAVAVALLGRRMRRAMSRLHEARPKGPKERMAAWGVGVSAGIITVSVHVLGRAEISRVGLLAIGGLVLGCLGLASFVVVLAREETRRFEDSSVTGTEGAPTRGARP